MKVGKKCEPEKVKLSGKGLEKNQTASLSTDFMVDATNAGFGDLNVNILVWNKMNFFDN